MDMLQQIIQLVIILFLLSMVCERIADFLKHYLSESNFFKIGDTLTKSPNNSVAENKRAYRIMKINVCCGVITATILKADLIKIFNNIESPGQTIGWSTIEGYNTIDYCFLIPGIVLTGCFISFGSKFWHDLLDILYEIKNTKRVLSDPDTYKIDNTNSLLKVFNTYQSEFIKAAWLDAKTKYMAMSSVKAISIKSNNLGYYFEIMLSKNESDIEQYFQYLLDDGTPFNIPIKIKLLAVGDKIMAHNIDLSAKVFDSNNPDNFGTLGVLVKPQDEKSSTRYLLTCCHTVIENLQTNLPYDPNENLIKAGSAENNSNFNIGNVEIAVRDHEIDAALIRIDSTVPVSNSVPRMGKPQKVRQLSTSDVGNVDAFIYGAVSGSKNKKATQGTITSIHNEIKITYSSTDEFTIINTIAISKDGKAISEPGDSGAVVLDASNNVLGIVVAGSEDVTYILPINSLLTKLNVQLA